MDSAWSAGGALPVGRAGPALLGVITTAVAMQAAAAVSVPRIATLLGRARLVVAGSVIRVESFESGRVTVGFLQVGKAFKGSPGPADVAVVEEHDRSSSVPVLRTGEYLVAFLEPAGHASSLAAVLPAGRTYMRLLDEGRGLLASGDAATIEEARGLVARMVEASSGVAEPPGERERKARALVFDEVGARHPRLVFDGAVGLGGIPALSTTLTDAEQERLAHALARQDLPTWVRVEVVRAVGTAHLSALAPRLRDLPGATPEVRAAAWAALEALGQPPTLDELRRVAADPDPAVRAVVPTAMLVTKSPDGIAAVEEMALGDHDLQVEKAAVAALGATRSPAAVPSLERIYRKGPAELRQPVAQALVGIGGSPAADALARLATDGPRDGQKFAATVLLAVVPPTDPRAVELREHHPDPELRDLLEHGPYLGHHHD